MGQLTMFLMAIFLVHYAFADIMIQPGYEHSHSTQKSDLEEEHQPITQPPETLPNSEDKGHESHPQSHSPRQLVQQQGYMDPGYHLELYPVYSDSYHVPAQALSPMFQQVILPPMSRTAYRRLLSDMNSYGSAGIPGAVLPYYQYPPIAAHNRYRRSNPSEEPDRIQRDEHDDVATKSPLDDSLSVVDLQDQEKKRVNTRQSVSLLGLNPSNMYPVQQQYRSVELKPSYNPYQQIPAEVKQEMPIASPIKTTTSLLANKDLHHALLLQKTSPQKQQQRNSLDSMVSASVQSSPVDIVGSQREFKISTEKADNHKDQVGTKLGDIYKIRVHQHVHNHGKIKDNMSKESYSITIPTNAHHDAEPSNNLTPIQPAAEQVYSKPTDLGTNYLPYTQYTVAPQSYPVSDFGNYVWSCPYPSPYSPYRICFDTNDIQQPVVYQLA
ncbi:uncharacterized protein LOC117233230 [Bombus vosnesenskii]|uniref:Uncharacterized protein LOC117233230 n=1 Tax=Bombus vosnesenskii TaxID=207650 RepID=A0A6J3K835_9HYME|nr:uncharacterized protein LOC117233230 [Bombus vosnesenskii]